MQTDSGGRMLSVMRVLVLGIGLALTWLPSFAAVRVVAPDHSQAEDAGWGREDKPYRTLTFAMSRLMPGDTLRIMGGVYRDALILPRRAWSKDKPTTIEGASGQSVTLLGTEVVEGWESGGGGRYVKRAWPEEPQQVVVNGALLKQIGGTIFEGFPLQPGHALGNLHRSQGGIWPTRRTGTLEEMPPGSFLYDQATRNLYVNTVDGKAPDKVEVAVRPYLIRGENVEGIVVRNIRVRYANTTTKSRQGAVTLIGHDNTLDGVVVDDVDGVGIEVSGDDNIVRNGRVMRAGYLGIKARGRRVLIENNEVSFNNTRGFNKWWEAGGMKFIGQGGLRDHSRVANNRVHHNFGDGIWFDWGNQTNWIERNLVAYNKGFGIHYEASVEALILDNQVFGNQQRGIYLSHSRDSWVVHNQVVSNGLEGIVAIDEQRNDPKGQLNLRPRNNRILANVLAWNGGAATLILPGETYNNASNGNLYVDDKAALFSMGWPRTLFSKMKLETWQQEESQDRNSRFVMRSPNSTIKAGLSREALNIDWSGLNALAVAHSLPANLTATALPAGVSLSGKAGPR